MKFKAIYIRGTVLCSLHFGFRWSFYAWGRTFDIYCTGTPTGPTDFLEMTKTNSYGQPENKF